MSLTRQSSLLPICGLLALGAVAHADDAVLRVCADPSNLPLSNRSGEGYENKIAEQLAHDLGRKLEYTYFPQRIGFVRNTLRKQDPITREYACDLIIGVPAGYDMTATTKPYMRSTYALVFPVRPELEPVKTPDDLLALPQAQLHQLRIGVFAQSPGADWLLRNRLLGQAVSFQQQTGDPEENPNTIIERELTAGRIDAAIVWGPIAAHLVRKHSGEPQWRAVAFGRDPQIKFDYAIAMGVRHGEQEWKASIDEWIANNRERIDAILMSYGIPLLDEDGKLASGFQTSDAKDAGSLHSPLPAQVTSLHFISH
jgi:quinoprotein dehydrogenase-associated probable ABC transporter substrate-binding protein